jgi:hypothetical protein
MSDYAKYVQQLNERLNDMFESLPTDLKDMSSGYTEEENLQLNLDWTQVTDAE